ncbi:hypothetical protein SESBI_23988 [Sesbania bispinosa]|nr:hypothetical protein SESBI_23988 [Sesbania bispinosa]
MKSKFWFQWITEKPLPSVLFFPFCCLIELVNFVSQEDACKCKVQNPVNSSRKLKGTVVNKTVELDDVDAAAHEKKLGLKISSEEKNEKVKICDSVGKEQKSFSPIRSILKNHKHISGSTSSGCNIQDDTEESHCDVQVPSSDRHVRFSAKDYVIDPEKKNSFETVFKLSSDVLPSSFGKEQSSGSDEGTALEASRYDDNITINIDKRKEVCPIVESKQFSNALEQVAAQNFLKPCTNQEKSKNFVEKSESLSKVAFCDYNLHRFDRGNMTTQHFSPYADISRPLSAFQAGQITGMNTKVSESEALSSTGKVIDHLEDPNSQFAAVNSNANLRTYLEPSSSCSTSYDKGNKRPDFPLHTCGDNEGQALGSRMWSDMFSADMIDKSFLLPGWGKGSVRNNCMEHDFLVCHSILMRHVVQKTLQHQVYPFAHYPARLGVTELHGKERADIYQHNSDRCSNNYVQPQDSELNLMRNPFIEQNKWDKMPSHKGYGMVPPKESSGLISPSSSQPTMRLMGKDVPIGRSSKEEQQFVGGDTRVDEESRRRHCCEDATKDNSLLGRCSKQDWLSGSRLQISSENFLQSEKFQSNQELRSTLLMKGPDSEFLNLRSNHVSQNGSLGVCKNARSNLHHITQVPTSCAIYNRAPDSFPEQLIVGAKPQGLSFQSQVLPTYNFSQPSSSNGEMNVRKKNHHVTNSALEFPILQSVVEKQAKTSAFKKSYRSLPPWLLGPTHERLPGTSSSNSFPQNTWGHNFTAPSVNHPAEVLYPPNSVTSHCPRKALLCPSSIIQPPRVPVTPLAKPPSAINSGCRNIIKVTDKVKDDMTTNDYHPCTNSRKRPAANLVDLTKPNKLPNIEAQENLSRMTGLARETSSANLQGNTRAVELDLRVGARSKCCQNNAAQNLNPRINLGFDSFDQDGMVISGPVKLSPGAKHILKPSQNIDQDNSRPIHSVIPIAATTDRGRDLELQRKLTKVYRF